MGVGVTGDLDCDACAVNSAMGPSYPTDMEESAEGFLRAARIMQLRYLGSSDARISSAGATALVPLTALGIEIALKSIALREDPEPSRTHELGALWARLDQPTRVDIESFERVLRDGPFKPLQRDFAIERVLQGDADSFITFRYRYETRGLVGVRADDLLRIGYALVRYLGAEPWPSGVLDE